MMRWMLRQAAFLLAAALLPAVASGVWHLQWRGEEPLAAGEVRVATTRLWGERVTWVDSRTKARHEAGHIPGAILLNEDAWDELVPNFLNEWDPDKTIVVYCDGGGCEASHAVATRLRDELKIPSVYVLKGGYAAWQSTR